MLAHVFLRELFSYSWCRRRKLGLLSWAGDSDKQLAGDSGTVSRDPLLLWSKLESSGQAGEYLALSIAGDYIAMFVKRKVPTADKTGSTGNFALAPQML